MAQQAQLLLGQELEKNEHLKNEREEQEKLTKEELIDQIEQMESKRIISLRMIIFSTLFSLF